MNWFLYDIGLRHEKVKSCTFDEKYCEKNQHVNGLVSPFSNSYNIRKLYPLHLNTRI